MKTRNDSPGWNASLSLCHSYEREEGPFRVEEMSSLRSAQLSPSAPCPYRIPTTVSSESIRCLTDAKRRRRLLMHTCDCDGDSDLKLQKNKSVKQ